MASKITLPKGLTIEQLQANWREADTVYQPIFKRAQVLDATDRGKLWKAINAKFPTFQVLPDTNDVSYVKNNLLASLYSVGRSAHINPSSENDREIVQAINNVLDHIWETSRISYYQMQAGERAALLNYGITQVGWDAKRTGKIADSFYKGIFTIKNIDPMKFMRDPYVDKLEDAAYCMTWDRFHKNAILRDPNYHDAFKTYLDSPGAKVQPSQDTVQKLTDQQNPPTKDYFKVIIHWVLLEGKYHEIHTVDNDAVIFVKEDILPRRFPFAELYCNLPAGDVIGTSEPSRIFASSVARNLMNSVMLTAEVKNQKPPRFVNTDSQINLRDFIQHGADSDYTFQVRGDASKAVHYHQFPQVSPMIQSIMAGLDNDMQRVTGITGKYTGKDTGSILTTGGMESMLNQATMIDQPKIINYEEYTTQLTALILGYLKEFGMKRSYFIKNPQTKQYETVTIDFDLLQDETIAQYGINISAYLPKNKQRIAQMANVLMEKQMQYGGNGQQVSLITPEEWLMMQDIPMQEYMMERMGLERSKDYVDKVSKVLFQYTELLDTGLPPEDALMATAEAMQTGQPSPLGPSGQGMPAQSQQLPPMDF